MKTLIIIPNDEKGKTRDDILKGVGNFSVFSFTQNTLTMNRAITAAERGFIESIANEADLDVIIIQLTDEQAEKYDSRVMLLDLSIHESL